MKSEQEKIIGWALVLCFLLLMTVSCSSTKALVVLLPEENGAHGAAAIGQGDKVTVLDAPMTAAKVDNRGRVEKEAITQDVMER